MTQNPPRFEDVHPKHIRNLLEALAPDRAPLPWDCKIERILNGLKEPHFYFGRSLNDDTPWMLHRPLMQRHGLIYGGSQSDRIALGWVPLITQLIARRESSIVIFDLQGNNYLFFSAFIEAVRAGLLFRWVSLDSASFSFPVFLQSHNQQRTISGLAQSLITSMGLAPGDTQKNFYPSCHLDTLTAFLTKFQDIQSFVDLAAYLGEKGSYGATKTDKDNSQLLQMAARQMASVKPFNVTEKSAVRPEVLRHAIDMTDVLTRKQVVFFRLPSQDQELIATISARLGLNSLADAARVLNRTDSSVPCQAFVDNFPKVCADNLKTLLDAAPTLSLILSHDDMSQLSHEMAGIVENGATLKLALEASSVGAMNHLIEGGGESFDHLASWSQPIVGDIDSDPDALAVERAYLTPGSDIPLIKVAEREVRTLTRNQILAVSAHPMQAFIRSRSDSGLTQYKGQWVPLACEYCTTYEEYKLRKGTPLPREHPCCVTVDIGQLGDNTSEPADLPNNPMPVPPPPEAVDPLIAARLRELQEFIRRQQNGPPKST